MENKCLETGIVFLHSFPPSSVTYFQGLAQVLHQAWEVFLGVDPLHIHPFQSSHHCLSLPHRQILPYITPGYVSEASPSSKGSKRAGIEFQGAHIPEHRTQPPVHSVYVHSMALKSANSLFFN